MAHDALVDSVLLCLRRAGFPLAGTCDSRVEERERRALTGWLDKGLHGSLTYMSRHDEIRASVARLEPWVRGVFCAALPYNTSRTLSAREIAAGRAWVSRYAWGRDYHKVLRRRMATAASLLRQAGIRARVCVDTAPLLERHLAWKAGLGFIGKNGLLVHPALGSYLFLGEILTDLDLPDSERVPDGCGDCRLCLKGCPTRAFTEPRVLNAGRCLSAWTIEHRGPFPPEVPPLKGHLFGCDRCQEVCPYNRRAPLSEERDFLPREGWFAPEPGRVAGMGEAEWDAATEGTAVRRARHGGLVRNARRILLERGARET